ncbi:Nramp family divalent metal transporter [Trinickia caryophylli]|uniref:Divalent metal cation transporter MntH n=1 Tax=Trinickia caryophylli TaxID=28094 RepID=A0A1X7FLJ0_TRICW|nr:Nramp family divalent metal transporter [Trinickia caryophylli]PMS13159.1 divalent metal cation transporter [Trinickia caryophylli]TRX19315.1 divalent metal cation transporter [Trinickia caryophylli]WQE13383.1 Nramp family divalent metal transporter [Trinickia caryophylli]SMF53656.1 manganese transport protein [Trinickia caryophylli]GLU34098.1 divalent metal cation transporter MntH [Trinickia caryophylli]
MTTAQMSLGMTQRTTQAIGEVLAGRRLDPRSMLLFAGPAVVASIAYMDPGNFAANIEAGSRYGYSLLWVVVIANAVAMLFQGLSAKLGIVTGRNLAEMSREQFSKPVVYAMWGVSEIAAMATDLAEFLGGAIGLSLLFHLPLMAGMVITGIVTYAILAAQKRGFRPIEIIIGALVAAVALSYVVELSIVDVDWGAAVHGTVTPQLPGEGALAVAAAMLGATVMPHAIYLHSGLTQHRAPARNDAARSALVRFSNREVVIALSLAGLVNMAMIVMAAGAFHEGHPEIAQIETAYRSLIPLFGVGAAAVFLVSLIASGVSSSVVGTMAGQMIMQGFVGFRIPVGIRRLATMAPAFVVVALGVNATDALVYSQVALSFALPVPMIALVIFTSRRDIMGRFVNSRAVTASAVAATLAIVALNAVLILQTLGMPVPGLGGA